MCRRYVLDRERFDDDTKRFLIDLMIEEGRDECNLDDDETRRLFDKNFVYLTRVFTHQGVQSVCHDFASTLKRRRRLSRLELLEELRALGHY